MSEPKIVDARWRPPPEPMEMTLEAVDTLGPDETVVLLIHREPFPLYDILARNGYAHHAEAQSDGSFAIRITRAK
ncbi:MAG: DUF2249 domain-containing protein [Rhodocyclaceae bacterium]|uniref:DUF2249 domain-containing protein n=1 Tax=Cognatazoarcus halotolerans TaxID=2686016 RepID=UPI001356FE20|nr:DUF2249 domain-containing protein [Cognatazoarcus halotolerans]MBX3687160.1 DUF2249 domain-containing protein [Rhodocyclaceae bacterium]MCP5239180.1 DUF2249 domain-containing protein [Zoogloeaceae bacterium]MCW5615828.1 DUF2249 domain-containing protein [Rhodocyclaceae bacterium]